MTAIDLFDLGQRRCRLLRADILELEPEQSTNEVLHVVLIVYLHRSPPVVPLRDLSRNQGWWMTTGSKAPDPGSPGVQADSTRITSPIVTASPTSRNRSRISVGDLRAHAVLDVDEDPGEVERVEAEVVVCRPGRSRRRCRWPSR